MQLLTKFLLLLSLIFLISCSASYEKLSKTKFSPPNELSKYLHEEYKKQADFEAKEMHDWNSTKLYAEKSLSAAEGIKVFPQKITYWNIQDHKRFELIKGYNNLMLIYDESISIDPINLAKAISSLDCWGEQQEENWQTWDINLCRDNFISAMHNLYDSLKYKQESKKIIKNQKINNNVIQDNKIIIKEKEDNKKAIVQIVYFDFDKTNISNITVKEISNFINLNKKIIKKYIVIGHTDTMGTKKYNIRLSIERAETVKNLLIQLGINSNNIKILGKGENDLSIETEDEIAHPANRRAEISLLN